VHHDRVPGVPPLPAPIAARVARPLVVDEVPSDWLEPESEEIPAAAPQAPAPSPPPPRVQAASATPTPIATPVPTAVAIESKSVASEPPKATPIESANPAPSPPAPSPPAEREERVPGDIHIALPPPSEASPPPELARAKAAPPPLPETQEPESTSPTIAAAASSITIPQAKRAGSEMDEPINFRRGGRTRVIVVGAALLATGFWIALRGTSGPPVGSQAVSNGAKAQLTAAPTEPAQPARPVAQAAHQADPANPAPVDTTTPAPTAPTPAAETPAPTPAPAPIEVARAAPEKPADNAQGNESGNDEPRSPKKVAATTTPAPPRAAATAAKPERPLETELPDPGAAPARAAKSNVDDDALQQALAQAAQRAKGCHVEGGPKGTVRVSVTFAPSGDVTGASVQGAAFTNTVEGECIAAKFRALHIPAFTGNDFVARKAVTIE
jgi:hypothetical protein